MDVFQIYCMLEAQHSVYSSKISQYNSILHLIIIYWIPKHGVVEQEQRTVEIKRETSVSTATAKLKLGKSELLLGRSQPAKQ